MAVPVRPFANVAPRHPTTDRKTSRRLRGRTRVAVNVNRKGPQAVPTSSTSPARPQADDGGCRQCACDEASSS